MIYLDNAATTLQKPEVVADAVRESFSYIGNAGRGANDASLFTSRLFFQTRKQIADFFHMTDKVDYLAAEHVIFTMNATESLNIVIKGILNPGDHVITTQMEHNSVLRPLYEMEKRGVELTILPCEKEGVISCEKITEAIRKNTKAIVCTHASNVTGMVNDITEIGTICLEHGLYFVLDASQTAGTIDIDMEKNHISALCFTGHKGLFGPQGTGGICLAKDVAVRPLLSGGSGVHSFDMEHPKELPTALEAGTLNGHGIAGLHAALTWIKEFGIETIHSREMELKQRFLEGIREIPGIRIYGSLYGSQKMPYAHKTAYKQEVKYDEEIAIVACNIAGLDASYVSLTLDEKYGIATRAGAHCAPLMHKYFGTEKQGIVRFSFSYFNTEDEIDTAIAAMKEIAAKNRGHVTAYVGAGGKTSTIREKTEKYVEQGEQVLIFTTTKMMIPERKEIFAACPEEVFLNDRVVMSGFFKTISDVLNQYGYCMVGTVIPDTGKFGILPEFVMEELLYMADEIQIEADGSAHLPIKAPAEYEPVLLPFMDEVVILMGAHAVGRPLKEVCHRLSYAKDILKCKDDLIVTEDDLKILMEDGYAQKIRAQYPGMRLSKVIKRKDYNDDDKI